MKLILLSRNGYFENLKELKVKEKEFTPKSQ